MLISLQQSQQFHCAWYARKLLGVTTLSVEGWLPRRSERAKKVGEERGEARGVPVNASCGRTVKNGDFEVYWVIIGSFTVQTGTCACGYACVTKAVS